MGPSLTDALVVTVAYPQTPQRLSSRVLRIPLQSLSSMMNGLHQQGAVVTHVGASIAEHSDSAPTAAENTPEDRPSRKRASNKKG